MAPFPWEKDNVEFKTRTEKIDGLVDYGKDLLANFSWSLLSPLSHVYLFSCDETQQRVVCERSRPAPIPTSELKRQPIGRLTMSPGDGQFLAPDDHTIHIHIDGFPKGARYQVRLRPLMKPIGGVEPTRASQRSVYTVLRALSMAAKMGGRTTKADFFAELVRKFPDGAFLPGKVEIISQDDEAKLTKLRVTLLPKPLDKDWILKSVSYVDLVWNRAIEMSEDAFSRLPPDEQTKKLATASVNAKAQRPAVLQSLTNLLAQSPNEGDSPAVLKALTLLGYTPREEEPKKSSKKTSRTKKTTGQGMTAAAAAVEAALAAEQPSGASPLPTTTTTTTTSARKGGGAMDTGE